jgi:ribonuclease-3
VFRHLWNRIKLFLRAEKEFYSVLYRILGFYPKDLSLYEEALLHRSSHTRHKTRYRNNERLEFLGDAILDAVVGDIVFRKYPTRNEGFLTTTRSKIVQRETLNRIAIDLGLNKLIISSAPIKNHNSHILGNALEAFVGAVYLDQGYRKTSRFIEQRIIKPYIDIEELVKKDVNFKSKLLEWGQRNRVTIDYEIVEKYRDDNHNQIFHTHVILNGITAGVGIGYSKKESHQEAAQIALRKIKNDKTFGKEITGLSQADSGITEPDHKNPVQ